MIVVAIDFIYQLEKLTPTIAFLLKVVSSIYVALDQRYILTLNLAPIKGASFVLI